MATLKYHKPGELTVISIPQFDTEHFPSCPKINYRKLLSSLLPPTDSDAPAKPESSNTDSIPSGAEPDLVNGVSPVSKARGKHCNIVERLEKKYFGSVTAESEESDSMSSGNNVPSGKDMKKRKLKSSAPDDYDLNDSFIDDSETIIAAEKRMKVKRTKTKHDGFFVSSGELEVVYNSEEVGGPAPVKSWDPPEGLVEALQVFRAQVREHCGLDEHEDHQKIPQIKYFPRALDEHLSKVDIVAADARKGSVRKNSPYLAALREALGSGISDGALKTAVLRIRAHRAAVERHLQLMQRIEEVGTTIRNKIVAMETDATADSARYSVKWDTSLRGDVCSVEELCMDWVAAENDHRSRLRASDKKEMSESETIQLNGNRELTKVLKKVSAIAFAAPYSDDNVEKGGLSGLRKALTTEKGRRKRNSVSVAKERSKSSTQPPTQPSTQPPTQPSTQPPTQPSTQPPTQPSTQPPTQPSEELTVTTELNVVSAVAPGDGSLSTSTDG